MNTDDWRCDIDRGKPMCSKKNSHCHSVHHKIHMEWPEI